MPTQGRTRTMVILLGVAVAASCFALAAVAYRPGLISGLRGTPPSRNTTQTGSWVSGGALSIQSYPAFRADAIDFRTFESALEHCRVDVTHAQVPLLAHGILVWGDEPGTKSGSIASLVLDHNRYRNLFSTRHPLLVRSRYGARFEGQSEQLTYDQRSERESHTGQLIAALAECGIAPSRIIQTAQGPSRVSDLIEDLMANFTLNDEMDWAVAALTIYLPPARGWRNKFGTEFTFDSIASRLADRTLGQGSSCHGTHTLYTMALLLQADQRYRILAPDSASRLAEYLKSARDLLAASQDGDGYWTTAWASGRVTAAPLEPDRAVDAVWITGHHLDWMAISPPKHRVAAPALRRASEFVCRQTSANSPESIARKCCSFFHGVRATRRLIDTSALSRLGTDGDSR